MMEIEPTYVFVLWFIFENLRKQLINTSVYTIYIYIKSEPISTVIEAVMFLFLILPLQNFYLTKNVYYK